MFTYHLEDGSEFNKKAQAANGQKEFIINLLLFL